MTNDDKHSLDFIDLVAKDFNVNCPELQTNAFILWLQEKYVLPNN